jgi:hypothetical protein
MALARRPSSRRRSGQGAPGACHDGIREVRCRCVTLRGSLRMESRGDRPSTSRMGRDCPTQGAPQKAQTCNPVGLMNGTDALISLIGTLETAEVPYIIVGSYSSSTTPYALATTLSVVHRFRLFDSQPPPGCSPCGLRYAPSKTPTSLRCFSLSGCTQMANWECGCRGRRCLVGMLRWVLTFSGSSRRR